MSRQTDPLYRGPATADQPATVAGPRGWVGRLRGLALRLAAYPADALDVARELVVPFRPLLACAFAAVYASADTPTRTFLWVLAGLLVVLSLGRRA